MKKMFCICSLDESTTKLTLKINNGKPYTVNVMHYIQRTLTLWHTNFFCELVGTNRFITLKIDTICLCHTPFDRSFFSALNRYMTRNAIYRQKSRIKSKTSVAQTVSQPAVYAKGLQTIGKTKTEESNLFLAFFTLLTNKQTNKHLPY
jgi:hypothetical protein